MKAKQRIIILVLVILTMVPISAISLRAQMKLNGISATSTGLESYKKN